MQNVTAAKSILRDSPVAEPASSTIVAPRPWLQDLWLWILLVGPLVAPLFMATGLPILKPFADGIYLIGEVVCPKVGVHMMFLGHHTAVCYSCWAAVWGLWVVRLLYGRAGEGFGPLRPLNLQLAWSRWESTQAITRLGVLALGFIPWALDVMLWDLGIWNSPSWYMTLAGFLGGVSAGLVLLPAASSMRTRLARRSHA